MAKFKCKITTFKDGYRIKCKTHAGAKDLVDYMVDKKHVQNLHTLGWRLLPADTAASTILIHPEEIASKGYVKDVIQSIIDG